MPYQRALTAESSNLHFSIALAENRENIHISSGYKNSHPMTADKQSYLINFDSERGLLYFYLLIPKLGKPTSKTKPTYVERMLQLVYVLSEDRREYWKVEHHVDLKRQQHTPLNPTEAKPIKDLYGNIKNDLESLNSFLSKRITQLTVTRHRLKTFSIISSIALLIGGISLGGSLLNADIYIALGTCICLCLSIGVPMMVRGRLNKKLVLNTHIQNSLRHSPKQDVSQDAESLLEETISN